MDARSISTAKGEILDGHVLARDLGECRDNEENRKASFPQLREAMSQSPSLLETFAVLRKETGDA